jgi:hypothetical protein
LSARWCKTRGEEIRCAPITFLACCSSPPCGDNRTAPATPDGPPPDGPRPDSPEPDGIAEARATTDDAGLDLPIRNVTVTYLKPQIGSMTNDPAGFTIQAEQTGPALFISVDPATTDQPSATFAGNFGAASTWGALNAGQTPF